jgi:hypothetical protein
VYLSVPWQECYLVQTLQEQTLAMEVIDSIVVVTVQWALTYIHVEMCSLAPHPDVDKQDTVYRRFQFFYSD